MTDIRQKTIAKYIAPIDEAELIVRMIEAGGELKRPPGKTAAELLDNMPAEERAGWRRISLAAMDYWRECIQQMQAVS